MRSWRATYQFRGSLRPVMFDCPGYAKSPSCRDRAPPIPPLLIQMSTSSSLVKQRCSFVNSRTPTSDVCASLWYPYHTGVLLAAA